MCHLALCIVGDSISSLTWAGFVAYLSGRRPRPEVEMSKSKTPTSFFISGSRGARPNICPIMSKRLFFILALLLVSAPFTCFAQRIEYEESQSRILEPLQDVYIRPLVADMQLLKNSRQTYGPFLFNKGVDISKITIENVDNAKKNAAYNAAQIDDADLIVGAVFRVTSAEKGGGIYVEVSGFPVKYTNWHLLGENGDDDYKWLQSMTNAEYYGRRSQNEQKDAAISK